MSNTPTLLGKTTRNLSQFAEKKLVGKAHTRADRNDVSEGIPSNIQITTATIFGEEVPSTPADNIDQIALYDVDSNDRIQKVELVATVINGTSYDAAASEADGGGDSPQNTGPHAYSLALPADYETPSGHTNNNPKKGTGPFVNDKRLFDTLGALQIVPTNLFIDPTFGVTNPYGPKVYYNDSNGSPAGFFGLGDPIDWFVDPYAGIVFLQEYDEDKIPYKVECFIYIGDMADQTTGSGATTLNGLNDVNVPSPSNNQVLTYNSANSKWEAQNSSGGGGIERYSYTHVGATVNPDTDITISGMDFTGLTPTNTDTKLYLNGQLLLGGSVADVTADSVDYAFNNNTQVRFSFEIEADDHIVIFYTTTSFSTGKPFVLHTSDAAFSDGLLLTGGDGITIAPYLGTQLLVSNTGLLQRTKANFTGLTHSNNVFTFTLSSIDFSDVSHSDHQIDVFVDGSLQEKDYNYQFVTNSQTGTLEPNQLEWIDGSPPSNSARFTIIIY